MLPKRNRRRRLCHIIGSWLVFQEFQVPGPPTRALSKEAQASRCEKLVIRSMRCSGDAVRPSARTARLGGVEHQEGDGIDRQEAVCRLHLARCSVLGIKIKKPVELQCGEADVLPKAILLTAELRCFCRQVASWPPPHLELHVLSSCLFSY